MNEAGSLLVWWLVLSVVVYAVLTALAVYWQAT
jgi:hypothetical protein